MKFYAILLVVVLGLLSACRNESGSSAGDSGRTSQAGGADGGGGDLPQSNARDVKQEIETAMRSGVKTTLYNLALAQDLVDDPYVIRVLQDFFTGPRDRLGWDENQPVFMDLQATPYRIEEEGSCYDPDGRPHAAGVEKKELGSKICFSLKALRAIPKEDLKLQITALIIHELAHHFGFGELEAVRIQSFILHHSVLLFGFSREMAISLSPFSIPSVEVKDIIWQSQVIFQDGRIISPSQIANSFNKDGSYCAIHFRYRDEDYPGLDYDKWILPKLQFLDSYIKITGRSVMASSDHGVTDIYFNIDSYGAPTNWIRDDQILTNLEANRKHSASFSCHGKNLRLMDLHLILGEYGGMPLKIKDEY